MKYNYSRECLYKDTYTIIEMMDEEMRQKINYKFIEFLRDNKDDEFAGTVNKSIPLKEQKLLEEIKIMLSLIYINYFSEDKEAILKEEEAKIEQFYNRNIFEKRKEKVEEKSMIEYKENLFNRIINKIKRLLKK